MIRVIYWSDRGEKTMGQELTKADYAKENKNFWWNYLLLIRGFDEKKKMNFDEVVVTSVNPKNVVPDFAKWYQGFYPYDMEEDGEYENPNHIKLELPGGNFFMVEFQSEETNYYLNDKFLGNMGEEFEAWFFTWKEMEIFEKVECGFLLALPMLGLLSSERKVAEAKTEKYLKELQMFEGKEVYLAKCLVNGLIIKGGFQEKEGFGITNTMENCVRNISKYPRYKGAVREINNRLVQMQE